MDYIREELLRQRMVWSALLRGGQTGMEAARQEQQATYATVGGMELETAESVAALRAAEVGRALSRQEAELAVQTLLWGQETAWQPPQGEKLRQEDAGAAGRYRRASGGEAFQEQRSGAMAETEKAGQGAVRIVRPERSREQGVKELSRLIQRDSRRYDGGFALY